MKKLLLIISFFISISTIYSQNDGDIDPTFTIGNSLVKNGVINATATQTDGKILAAGNFFSHDNVPTVRIIRLNPDGSTDTGFNTGAVFSGVVYTIALQTDGKILLGGTFTDFNGSGYNYIIRLNSDGSVDSSFNVGSGFNNLVRVIKVLSDGKILVLGSFSAYNSSAAKKLVRLNPDGSIDNTLAMGTGFTSAELRALAIQPDGKMIIGGYITGFNGSNPYHILRLNYDGSKDTSFTTGVGFDNYVYTISLQANGQIIVGGSFTTFNGGGYFKSCIRLNSNGTRDTTFPASSGFNGNVYASAVLADGKIILGGHFSTYRGNLDDKIIRLNVDGTKDTSFLTGTGMNADVNCLLIQPDNKVLVGGEFNFYNGTPGSCLIRLNSDGIKDTAFDAGSFRNRGQLAFGLTKQADGKIIAVGDFTNSFGNALKGIVRFNTDGTTDTSFNTGSGANYDVQCAAVQSDGKIVVGGKFTSFNGILKNYILRLNSDGSIDNSFNIIGSGFDSSIYSLAVQSDGKIVVGGLFKTFNGLNEKLITRLNTDGSKDSTFLQTGTGFDTTFLAGIRSLTLQPDGKILASGIFNNYNGVSKSGIVRFNTDGTLDSSFNYPTQSGPDLWSSLVLPNGKILIGGQINVQLLNQDGSVDTSFNQGVGFDGNILAFAMQPNGKIVMAGSISSFEGLTVNGIIRFNADMSVDTSFNSGTGFDTTVYALLASDDNKIIAGGNFIQYNGSSANGIVKLQANNQLGIANYSQSHFSIYPNPVKDFINISAIGFSSLQNYVIYDILGKSMKTGKNPKIIDANGLAPGYYILKLNSSDGVENIKFIKD